VKDTALASGGAKLHCCGKASLNGPRGRQSLFIPANNLRPSAIASTRK